MSEQRAAIYARYSDHEQDGSSTIESQIRECRTYARAHGLSIAEDAVFIDRARSGTTTEQREQFQRMIAAAQRTPRPFGVILVWKFSRFARNREDSALYKSLLRRRGVQVISASEPVDQHSATGILTEAMIEAIDAFYSARLAEEVRRGQTQTALDGYSTGGRAPYGYRRLEVRDALGRVNRHGEPIVRVTLEIEPAEAAILLRIFETYTNGGGYKKIVLALNREGIPGPRGGSWDISAVQEILRNPIYRGARVYGRNKKVRTEKGTRSKRAKPPESWIVKEGAHPAIISSELWERVRQKRERVAELYRHHGMAQAQLAHSRYMLSGVLVCAECGGHFVTRGGYKTKAGLSRHYACGRHTNRGSVVCPNKVHLPHVRIEQELLDVLLGMVLTPQNLERLLTMLNARLRDQAAQARPQIKEIKKAFAAVEREIANYTRAIGRGDFTSLEAALTAAEVRRTTLTAELARLDRVQPRAVLQLTPAALQHRLQGLIEEFRSGEPGRVREAIQATVGRVVVGVDGTMTIEARLEGLLGLDESTVPSGCRGRESNPHEASLAGF